MDHLRNDPLFPGQRQTNLGELCSWDPPALSSKNSDDQVRVNSAELDEGLGNSSSNLWTVVVVVVHVVVGVVGDVSISRASAIRSDEHSAILLALGSVSSAYHLQDGTRVELVTNIKDESISCSRELDVKSSGKLGRDNEYSTAAVLCNSHLDGSTL